MVFGYWAEDVETKEKINFLSENLYLPGETTAFNHSLVEILDVVVDPSYTTEESAEMF